MMDWWWQGELDYKNRVWVPPSMEQREAWRQYVCGWTAARDREFGYYETRYEGE